MDLSPLATSEANSKGRVYPELIEYSSPFLIDRERIIKSIPFRRLEYKTQVLYNLAGDHFRTRLTHTLEVAQNAKIIARRLRLNEDLSEVIALAHDIGHPPFGHAGEDVLNEIASVYGGFNHNVQVIKILTKLDQKFPNFPGLNLTWESIEGIIKHNGPIIKENGKCWATQAELVELDEALNLKLDSYSSLEAQVAAISDDIAYIIHDIEDGIRAGILTIEEFFHIPQIKNLYGLSQIDFPKASKENLTQDTLRRLSKLFLDDVCQTTVANIKKNNIHNIGDVTSAGCTLVCFSEDIEDLKRIVKAYLFSNFYQHSKIIKMLDRGKSVIRELFEILMSNPQYLPCDWFEKLHSLPKELVARNIIDYISGMTDRFAIKKLKQLKEL